MFKLVRVNEDFVGIGFLLMHRVRATFFQKLKNVGLKLMTIN